MLIDQPRNLPRWTAYDMVPRRWILHCLKMYKIPDLIVQFIEKIMQTWRVELTTVRQSLAEVKMQRVIFQKDVPLLLVIAMMPLNYILRKCTVGYKFSKSQEKINHLMYMDDIKPFAKNEKELEIIIQTVRIYSQDLGKEFGIEKCVMLIMKSGKRHLMEGVELLNQVVIRMVRKKKGNLKLLEDIGSWHHQTTGNERKKNFLSFSVESENYSRQNLDKRRT